MPNASFLRIKGLAFFLIIVMGAGFLWPGCGKKGPPRPPQQALPAAVKDLSYSLDNDRVYLNWTVPGTDDRSASSPAAVKLFRHKQSVDESDCAKCPVRFTEIAELPVETKRSEESKSSPMRFTEILERGCRYIYKVVVYSKDGVGGNDSNMIEFAF